MNQAQIINPSIAKIGETYLIKNGNGNRNSKTIIYKQLMKFTNLKFKNISKKINEFIINSSYLLFNKTSRFIKDARGVRIIVYHGICNEKPHLFNSRFVTEKQFELHLKLLQKHYHLISYQDLITNKLSHEKLNVLITFDDGLKNNALLAAPLLTKYNTPAIFFVTAVQKQSLPFIFNDIIDIVSYIGPKTISINKEIFYKKKINIHQRYVNKANILLSNKYHSSNYQIRSQVLKQIFENIQVNELNNYSLYCELMNETDIRSISSHPLFTIASHGFLHTDLTSLNSQEIYEELESSKKYLATITNEICHSIAFPYGNYNKEVLNACYNLEFKYTFKTEKHDEEKEGVSVFERQTINPFISPILQMYYIAKNNYE
jgi:peptidoglycan/xylan/chitin deacetylase (PgdA/CDA1 family)